MTASPWNGKILIVWNVPPDPTDLLRIGRDLEVDGFDLKIADGASSWLDRRGVTRGYVEMLRAAPERFRVLGWSYAYCDGAIAAGDRGDGVPAGEAAAALAAIDALDLDGWSADLEIECEGHPAAVAELLDRVRAGTARPIAAFTWADLAGHAAYPAEQIAAGVAVVRPMVYRPIWTAAAALRVWLPRVGDPARLCPAWGLTDPAATAAALAEDMAAADAAGLPGESYWELSGYPGQPGVRELIRDRVLAAPVAAPSLLPTAPAAAPGPHPAVTAALDGIWAETERLAAIEHVDRAVAIQRQVIALKEQLATGALVGAQGAIAHEQPLATGTPAATMHDEPLAIGAQGAIAHEKPLATGTPAGATAVVAGGESITSGALAASAPGSAGAP